MIFLSDTLCNDCIFNKDYINLNLRFMEFYKIKKKMRSNRLGINNYI